MKHPSCDWNIMLAFPLADIRGSPKEDAADRQVVFEFPPKSSSKSGFCFAEKFVTILFHRVTNNLSFQSNAYRFQRHCPTAPSWFPCVPTVIGDAKLPWFLPALILNTLVPRSTICPMIATERWNGESLRRAELILPARWAAPHLVSTAPSELEFRS